MMTMVNLRFTLPKVYDKPLLPDLTNVLKNRLRRPPKEGDMELETILVYGTMGVGKTWMEATVDEIIHEVHGTENVNSIMSTSYQTLYDKLGHDPNGTINKCAHQVLILDDPFAHQQTYGGRDKEIMKVIANHLKIRHRAEEVTGRAKGRIYTIMGPQQITGFETALRTAKIQIFLSTMGPHERKKVIEALNGNMIAYQLLGQLEDKKEEDNAYKSYGIVKIGAYQIGYVYLPPFKTKHYTYFEPSQFTKEKIQLKRDSIVDKWLPYFKKLPEFQSPSLMKEQELNDRLKVVIKQLYKAKQLTFEERDTLIHKELQQLKAELREHERIIEIDALSSDKPKSEDILPISGEEFQEYAVRCIKEDLGKEPAKILQLTYEGLTQEQIALRTWGDANRHHKVSRTLKRISESYIGYYFQDWYCAQNNTPSEAGNTNKADFNKEGDIRSLKCRRTLGQISINLVRDCKPEINLAKELNTTFRVVVCNIYWKIHKDHYIQITKPLEPDDLPNTIVFNYKGNIFYN